MDFRVTMPSFVPTGAHRVMHNQAAEPSTSHGAGAGGEHARLGWADGTTLADTSCRLEPPLH